MTDRRNSWRLVFLSYPCDYCGAQPGQDCHTATGATYRDVHAIRTQHKARCPRCGTVLAADDEPGQLCPRCQLLRRLEIERITRWQRQT